jgi:hypothetical protein
LSDLIATHAVGLGGIGLAVIVLLILLELLLRAGTTPAVASQTS